ncbi:MAG TPA: cysteine peptidase family C39 domain-containing protein [Candidatus Kapabacteria bacterium]|nr:cysteine peptidase family C39 domain-containing protein [Candidatus Kapabacteria bacterium]
MGFYPQSNRWQCGPFALKHALAILGQFVDEKELTKRARTTRAGTDEKMLTKAAKCFQADLTEIRKLNEDSAHRALTSYLKKGIPCLICINQWGHWVTVVGYDPRKDRFVVIDSEKDPVVRIPSWTELKRRWVYDDHAKDGTHREYYDFYPVKTKYRNRTKANFSITRAMFLRRPSNAGFVKHFDEYVMDMVDLAHLRAPNSRSNAISMAEFLRRHGKMLSETVCYMHGGVTMAKLNRILRNMQFVAETYGLVIRQDEEKRTIAAIAALLMTWATSHEPVLGGQALYGKE